jgi:hypothetical protein
MNSFKQQIQLFGQDPALVERLVAVLTDWETKSRLSGLDWEDLYWIASYLYQHDDAGQADDLIMKALEQAHSTGMNPHSNRELYLDGVMMLARLYLKYGQYVHAVNYLTELRDNGGALPDWAHLHYCIAMVYAYPQTVLFNPAGFLHSFTSVSRQNKENFKQLQAVAKCFLDQGTQYLALHGLQLGQEKTGAFYLAFHEHGLTDLVEWEAFVREAAPEAYLEFLTDHGHDEPVELDETGATDVQALLENQMLRKKVLHLEEELRRLREEITALQAVHVLKEASAEQTPSAAHPATPLVTTRRRRLLVFGDNRVPEDKLKRYANAIGFPSDDIDFYLDYEKNRRFNLNSIQYHSPYVGILVGPNAHKMVNLGDYSSMLTKLRGEPGFPYCIEMRTLAGELKITKTSFEAALMTMMDYIDAIGH